MTNIAKQPAYRQPWFWLVLSPLIVVIAACFWMLYIAIATSDGVVTDSYYKDGLSIVARNEQRQNAIQLGLTARLQIIENQIHLDLSGQLKPLPDTLSLTFVFKTKASFDVVVPLNQDQNGRYRGQLTAPISGLRQLLLEPADGAWRLTGQLSLPSSRIHQLTPTGANNPADYSGRAD